MKIDKVDDLSSELFDIIEERYTYPHKFERGEDTEEYTFTGNNECSAKSHNECSNYAKELGEFESDAVHGSETLKTQCSEEVLQDVP